MNAQAIPRPPVKRCSSRRMEVRVCDTFQPSIDGGSPGKARFEDATISDPCRDRRGRDEGKVSRRGAAKKTRARLDCDAWHGRTERASGNPETRQRRDLLGHETEDAREDWLITAEDVDGEQPFLEGSVVFQFACFGYGTPAESDFRHWLDGAGLNSSAGFVAALPKKLLSHPRGPIAFIGHVDTAWLHGFDDPESPYQNNLWSTPITPYKKAIEVLLGCQPVALAISDLNKRIRVRQGS